MFPRPVMLRPSAILSMCPKLSISDHDVTEHSVPWAALDFVVGQQVVCSVRNVEIATSEWSTYNVARMGCLSSKSTDGHKGACPNESFFIGMAGYVNRPVGPRRRLGSWR